MLGVALLKTIKLGFTESPDLDLPVEGVTIFVGPNNSGKSLVLRELEQAHTVDPYPSGLKIVKEYDVVWPPIAELSALLSKYEKQDDPNIPMGHIKLGRIGPNGRAEGQVYDRKTFNLIASEQSDKHWWLTQFSRWGLIRLDGRSRFNLTNDMEAGDLLSAPLNTLSHLFQDDEARRQVRTLIHDAFGLIFVVDPTSLGTLRIRLSQDPPPIDEQSLNIEARAFYRNAMHIKDASDGVQAFAGIATAVLSGDYHTILIDEPEAFLHPPLARKLGKSLAKLVTERGGSLLASTHSSDFLMGCVQASKEVRVVRLEYAGGKSKGKVVDPGQLDAFFRNPLMRSANAISALFYDGVVVTESDNDRAFYAEIYHRLAEVDGTYPSILFINAQNKQTIKDIIGPLRQFGVPAAAITDIDIVKDGGRTWTDWLTATQVPPALHGGYATLRGDIKSRFEATGKDMKRDGGVGVLTSSDQQAAKDLFDFLDSYGLFVVRGGELENWLPSLAIPGKKTDWTISMLERMGADPSDPSYVKPADGDIWDFMRGVVAWVSNPARRGIA